MGLYGRPPFPGVCRTCIFSNINLSLERRKLVALTKASHPCPLLFPCNTAVEVATDMQKSLRNLNLFITVSLFSAVRSAGILKMKLWMFLRTVNQCIISRMR
jgi:hypothetical protein